MKPLLTPVGSPSPLRLLNKGPDYLRRQMDGGGVGVGVGGGGVGGRGHAVSAVERLEADKAKYVKSRRVIDARQEPVLAPCATPPPPRPRPCPPPPRRSLGSDTPFSTLSSSPDENDNVDNVDNDDSRKENRLTATTADDVEARNRSNAKWAAPATPRTPVRAAPVAPHSAPVLRRSTGKRMLRPDSLVIYRQKKECKSPSAAGAPGANNNNGGAEVRGYSFVRRLFQGSMRGGGVAGEGGVALKMAISEEKAPSRDGGDSRMSWTNDKDAADGVGVGSRRSSKAEQESPSPGDGLSNGVANGNDTDDEADPWKRAPPPPPPPRRRTAGELWRSESDLRRRCSSAAASEQERFFDYCGLDLDLVERLGAGNFLSGGASSVDTLSLVLRGAGGGGGGASEPSEFSRHSGGREGLLFQEEMAEQLPPPAASGVSIIERNARVIKWLYGCRNAAQEGPKESTV